MNSEVRKRINSFLYDYAPQSDHPFIRVDYEAWAQHVYDQLVKVKRTNVTNDLPFHIREIIINTVFAMTSEAVDGTSEYQAMQDRVANGKVLTDMHKIYKLL